MPIKHRIVAALLGLGAIAGFGSAFFHMGAHAHARRAYFERHVADVCTDAALRAHRGERGDRDRDRGGRTGGDPYDPWN